MLTPLWDEAEIREQFRAFVKDSDFPCVGAKSALSQGNLKIVVCSSIKSSWDDVRAHKELISWARQAEKNPAQFRSLAFVFPATNTLNERQFEKSMWDRIQSFADKDAWLSEPYDHRVSSDPADPHFSLSFGGQAFFVVGMHPNASRPARRTPWPVMVFNLHEQFERLRESGRYDKIRDTIMSRDEAIAGSINPMLARHGEKSEALQYSGRLIDDGWQCPFADKRAGA